MDKPFFFFFLLDDSSLRSALGFFCFPAVADGAGVVPDLMSLT